MQGNFHMTDAHQLWANISRRRVPAAEYHPACCINIFIADIWGLLRHQTSSPHGIIKVRRCNGNVPRLMAWQFTLMHGWVDERRRITRIRTSSTDGWWQNSNKPWSTSQNIYTQPFPLTDLSPSLGANELPYRSFRGQFLAIRNTRPGNR